MPAPVPSKVTRGTPFVLDNPTRPASPAKLDTEFNQVVQPVNETIDFVRQAIADDGRIKPEALTTLRYVHQQTVASTVWIVNHNMGFYPTVHVFSPGQVEVEADVRHMDTNQTQIFFAAPYAGFATFQ